jgi:hypothetical protein
MQYIPENLREYESSDKSIPDRLQAVLRQLDPKWKLAASQRYTVNGNWIAGLEFEGRHFKLACDRVGIEVYEITGGREQRILNSPEEPPQNWDDTFFYVTQPKEIYEILSKAVA